MAINNSLDLCLKNPKSFMMKESIVSIIIIFFIYLLLIGNVAYGIGIIAERGA